MCFVLLAASLSALGLNFITAISGAATAICNVGPGLGDSIGPTGNFGSLPETAKWLLSLGMLLGRLELFTVLVMFSPAFGLDNSQLPEWIFYNGYYFKTLHRMARPPYCI